MNLVSRDGSHVVIRQVPVLLLIVTGLFSLPFLTFSLFHILRGTDADGKFFCLFLGLFLLWLFLEFVATRERIKVDLAEKALTRNVSGVFRHKEQVIDLRDMEGIRLEMKLMNSATRPRRRPYLYMYGSGEDVLLNSPAKVYLDHEKLGRVLGEVTGIPYQGRIDSK